MDTVVTAVEPSGDGPAVVVHIGEPKTGTTHFQEVSWRNRRLIAQGGVQLAGHTASDQFRAMQDLRGVPPEPDDPAGSWVGEWDVLAAQARRAQRIALISQESIAAADTDQAEHAVRSLGPDVHVVLTVRDFASLLPAEWQETVKHRRNRSWTEWLEHMRNAEPKPGRRPPWGFWRVHDTPEVLRTWARFLPPERMHVVTMPPSSGDPLVLWRRLAGLLGIADLDVDTDVRRNRSMGLAETEFFRSLNRALDDRVPNWFYAAEVKQALAHEVLAERPNRRRPELPPDVADWARRRSERTVEFLRSSGMRIVGDLDELLPATPAAGGADALEPIGAGDKLDVAVYTLAAQVERGHARGTEPSRPVDRTVTGRAMHLVRTSPRLKRTLRELADRPGGRWARVTAWRLHESLGSPRAGDATRSVARATEPGAATSHSRQQDAGD